MKGGVPARKNLYIINADGQYLMGALALHTGADVYAGDQIRWYTTHAGLANGRFKFRSWEGQLWHFSPAGGAPGVVCAPPVEFADVMLSSIP